MEFERPEDQERSLRKRQRFFKKLQPLYDHLENLVKGSIVVPRHEPDMQEIIDKGEFVDLSVRTVPMDIRGCHRNTACINHCFPERVAAQTGWVLSDEDGLWRQHSWGMDKQEKIILETSGKPRFRYYGITLAGERLKEFNWNNINDKCKCSDIEKLLED